MRKVLNHARTEWACATERGMLNALQGGCKGKSVHDQHHDDERADDEMTFVMKMMMMCDEDDDM